MTCRLHGIPLVDVSGEVLHEEFCTMNFADVDPATLEGIEAPFDAIFRKEVELLLEFSDNLLKRRLSQVDTFIPTALLIDFADPQADRWSENFTHWQGEADAEG
jgi:hypothetical protein